MTEIKDRTYALQLKKGYKSPARARACAMKLREGGNESNGHVGPHVRTLYFELNCWTPIRGAGCLPVEDAWTQGIDKGCGAIHAQLVYVSRLRPVRFSNETGQTPQGRFSVGASKIIEPEPFRAVLFPQEFVQHFSP
jgi:hypothetical protein